MGRFLLTFCLLRGTNEKSYRTIKKERFNKNN